MVTTVAFLSVAQSADFAERRQRAANEFHDGILLLHASSEFNASADGFHQDPYFYYFTGLENTVGALLAIDGKSNESWLFLPSHPPFLKSGLSHWGLPSIRVAWIVCGMLIERRPRRPGRNCGDGAATWEEKLNEFGRWGVPCDA
jgi:aminopeptidase P-like protein